LYKEKTLQFLCWVAVLQKELLASMTSDGLTSFWKIIDQRPTILSLSSSFSSVPKKLQ
jgi:hypothetical protein